MNAVIKLETFESRMEFHARLNPASTAGTTFLPIRSSSLVRSKIKMFASTAMPMERTNPAIPASVSVTGTMRKSASTISM